MNPFFTFFIIVITLSLSAQPFETVVESGGLARHDHTGAGYMVSGNNL